MKSRILSVLVLGLSLGSLVESDPSCDDNTKLKYEVGKSYVYNVKLVSTIGAVGELEKQREDSDTNGIIKTTGKAVLTALENCKYALTLHEVYLSGERHIANNGKGAGRTVPRTSVLFTFKNGEISGLHKDASSQPWTTNILRGILTMIQNKGLTNADGSPMDNESNIMGDCKVHVYAPNEGKYTKKIHMQQCSDSANSPVMSEGIRYDTPVFSNKLGIRPSRSYLKCVQILENDIVSTANCTEVDDLPVIHPLLEANSQLTIETPNKEPTEVGGATTEEIAQLTIPSSLLYDFSHNIPDSMWEQDLIETITTLTNSMYADHDVNKAEMYMQLKEKMRHINDFASLEKKLIASANGDQLHIQFLLNAVRDVGTEIGTEAAVVHLSKLMMKKGLTDGATTIFLSKLPFSRDPTVKGLEALGKIATSLYENFESTLTSLVFDFNEKKRLRKFVLGASGYAHQFCQRSNPNCVSVPEYSSLINTIAKFTSSKQPEIAPAALHALGNVEQLPPATVEIIKNILIHDEFLGKTKKMTAFEGFRRDPCQPELKKTSREILENSGMSLEMRIEAYLAITRCMQEEDAKVIDKILSNPMSELSSFIASHIYNVMDSQSPSKLFMKETALGQIGIPESIRSVHNDSHANRYFEFSTFDPIPNLGFSVDGHIFHQKGIKTPSFVRLNVTFDVLGKSYNVLQIGASSRLIPDVLPKVLMRGKHLGWKAKLMPLMFAVDSYYRVFGTTISMGLDVFDIFKAHEFIDQSQDSETGLWRFDFVHPFTLLEHEIEFPTLTGLPLTLKSEAAYFPMVSVNHTGDPNGLGIWDLASKWDAVLGAFKHHSISDSAFVVKGKVSIGKGTPIQIGIQGEGKLHCNHTIGYESQKSTANQWIKKIEFPEQVIWSKRLTADRTLFMEANGKLVDTWGLSGLPQQMNPSELFNFQGIGLRFRGTVLNKPTPSNGGPFDVMFAVEKTEEQFTGYSLDITTEAPEDHRKVIVVNLKANGLSSKDKIHTNIDLTNIGIKDLFNNDDKPKILLVAHTDISRNGESHGLKLDYKSIGVSKSDIDYESPFGELGNSGILALLTAGIVSRPNYSIKLETHSNNKVTDLLDWKIANGVENADLTLKFNGPLKPALGVIEGHLSIPQPAEPQKIKFVVDPYTHKTHKIFHVTKLNGKLSLDSEEHGKNNMAVDFDTSNNQISLDTSADVKGNSYKLKQIIPNLHHGQETEGNLAKSSHVRVLKAEYSDSFDNAASMNAVYSYNSTIDMNIDPYAPLNELRNMTIHLVKNGKEKPFIAEMIILKDKNHKGSTIEKRKLATLYVDNFGRKQAELTLDKNSTISEGNAENCNGKVVYPHEPNGNLVPKCKVVTAVAEAIVKDQFELVTKFSNADPAVTNFDIAGYHARSQISANLSSTITKENGGKVIHKTSKFFMDQPNSNVQYKQDTDSKVNLEERTLKSTTTLVKTLMQGGSTETWKTDLDGSLPIDPFNGESKLSMKHNGPEGAVLNVDVANNAQGDKTRFNNNLTVLIDHHGRSKVAAPKKQFTWAYTYVKDEIPEESKSKYDGSYQFISDLKLDELTQPQPHEMLHHHGQLNIFKLMEKESWTGNGQGLLKLEGKDKVGYDYSGTFDLTKGEATPPQGTMVKFAHGQPSGKTKLNLVMNGWLSQEMPELRNHTLFESYSMDFAPKQLRLIENIHLIYKKIDTQNGNVMSLVDVDGHKDVIFHSWKDFSIKENYKTQIDNKAYHHEKDIKMEGPHISVYVKNDDKDEDNWLIDFAGGAFEERHQHKFNVRSRSSHQKGLIPTTNFNVTISRRR